jgi:hypothetical protein
VRKLCACDVLFTSPNESAHSQRKTNPTRRRTKTSLAFLAPPFLSHTRLTKDACSALTCQRELSPIQKDAEGTTTGTLRFLKSLRSM